MTRRIIPLGLVVALLVLPAGAASPFVHPGLLHTRADLERMRAEVRAGHEPWRTGFERFRRDGRSDANWRMRGPVAVVRLGDAEYGSAQMVLDAGAAYQNALMWWLTGEEAHAAKALEILRAWSDTLRQFEGDGRELRAGLNAFRLINAAELMRHLHPGWTERDTASFTRLLRGAVLPAITNFAPFANGNWDAACISSVLAAGVFLDDRPLFERGLRYYGAGKGNGRLTHYVINEAGQCQESGRDQQHTQLGLGLLAQSCEIAWSQGFDLYGVASNRLLRGFEYTARYNLGEPVPFVAHTDTTGKYRHKSISEEGRGRLRPIYEMVWNHFERRRGVPAPWTRRAAERIRPEGDAWMGDHPGFGTLLFTRVPPRPPTNGERAASAARP